MDDEIIKVLAELGIGKTIVIIETVLNTTANIISTPIVEMVKKKIDKK